MKRLLRHWPLTLAALLALVCALCLWRLWAVSKLLTSQQAAERWKGGSERDFAQISCYMPPTFNMKLDDVYKFRSDMYQKLKGAGYDIESEKGLYADAWSASGTLSVSSGRRIGEVRVFAVGGAFFDFHPLRLVSGNYLRPEDVMDDRVLLDKETAWLLFGATDVAGMSFSLNGVPVVAAGVYEHERDSFSALASPEMCVYMSYSAFQRLFGESALEKALMESMAAISCYELVIAEPVKGFAYSSVTEKFPYKSASIVENSYRFEPERLYKIVKNSAERSMRKDLNAFPYWENAARAAEDRAALWLMLATLTGVFPIALLFYALIRYAVRGKRKLEDEILPNTGRKSRELVRAWNRRRWERRHPDEYTNDED